jgi:Anaphase-promoting complex, subunit 10 (APC10)
LVVGIMNEPDCERRTLLQDYFASVPGSFAACICLAMQVTSAKQGNGVEALRDGKDDTYWQSDGAQPHLVNIQFQRKVHLPSNAAVASAGLTGRTARHLLD